jgi:hypothetical protein
LLLCDPLSSLSLDPKTRSLAKQAQIQKAGECLN